MEKTIKLRVRKEKDSSRELKVLKLKGALITKGYIEIIHIADESEEFYLNSFLLGCVFFHYFNCRFS